MSREQSINIEENKNKLFLSGLIYEEHTPKHIQVFKNGIILDFFPASGKWMHGLGKKGQGFESMLKYLGESNV